MATKKDVKKRPPRTVKEKKFVKEYMASGNATKAALKVYNVSTEASAAQIGYENMRKLDMSFQFYNAGLTNEVLAQNTVRIALTAKKQNQFTGEVEEDNMMQLKAMEFASKLMGMIKAGETINNTQININDKVTFSLGSNE